MLSTHPDYERKGAASMLMKWGTEIADNLRLKSFVQGSPVGRSMYERHGFIAEEGWTTVPVSDKHKNRPATGWYSLTRPAKPRKIQESSIAA